jgi:succinyl-CoA synthetase alpha subunit
MAILVDSNTRVLIQGITGTVGSFQTRIMQEYGTNVVAGVTPGKGGQEVHGIPVYDTVTQALAEHEVDAAFGFVPARFAMDGALEVIDAGIPLLVLTAEGVPDKDMLTIISYAACKGTIVVGPDTPGVVSPGKCKLGVHPNRVLLEGRVGVLSKSGALSYEVCKTLTEAGIGQSTIVGIGGGPFWGLSQERVLAMFERDQETRAIVLLGEVGGTMEQKAAAYIKAHMSKPVVALIVGRAAPEGAQMGHAGAIIGGEEQTAASKIQALRDAGAKIAYRPSDIPLRIRELGVIQE